MQNVRERREAQAKREAAELIAEIGEARAATLLNVHATTVRRWLTGEVVAQTTVLIALRTLAGRHWDRSPDWQGFNEVTDDHGAGAIIRRSRRASSRPQY